LKNIKETTSSWRSVAEALSLSKWLDVEGESDLREELLSHFLTYPLTIARHIPSEASNLAILGARAESNLPSIYWEVLPRFVLEGEKKLKLSFIGPGVLNAYKSDRSSLLEIARDSSLFDVQMIDSFDALVLFNSGIGHEKEGSSWELLLETLKSRLSSSRGIPPTLFTSFNDEDFARDAITLNDFNLKMSNTEIPNRMRSKLPTEHVFANFGIHLLE